MEPEHQEQLRRELTSCVVRLIDVTETFINERFVAPAQIAKQGQQIREIARDLTTVCCVMEDELATTEPVDDSK